MALQIANPEVVAEVVELAAPLGLSKTAAVKRAVNEMLATKATPKHDYFERQLRALLDQNHALPVEPTADPTFELEWDESGPPK